MVLPIMYACVQCVRVVERVWMCVCVCVSVREYIDHTGIVRISQHHSLAFLIPLYSQLSECSTMVRTERVYLLDNEVGVDGQASSTIGNVWSNVFPLINSFFVVPIFGIPIVD